MIVETAGLSRTFVAGRGLFRRSRQVRAVSDVSLRIEGGTCLGIIGESGSGKSTLGRLLLGLLRPTQGAVRVLGRDLGTLSRPQWRHLRRELALVHQNPRAALDPRWTVGDQVVEPLMIHEPKMSRAALDAQRREVFAAVGLSTELLGRYPHQLSGGQRQRVVIARALALRPKLVVFDEPTSALDVSVQAQVMELIASLKRAFDLTYVFISHDLRNLRRLADRIAVMYAGRIVEEGPAEQVCREPAHPYTRALLAAVPTLARRSDQPGLGGEPPDPAALPGGCAFHPRCPLAQPMCATVAPEARALPGGRTAACHLPHDIGGRDLAETCP